jgi:hypothetical protein
MIDEVQNYCIVTERTSWKNKKVDNFEKNEIEKQAYRTYSVKDSFLLFWVHGNSEETVCLQLGMVLWFGSWMSPKVHVLMVWYSVWHFWKAVGHKRWGLLGDIRSLRPCPRNELWGSGLLFCFLTIMRWATSSAMWSCYDVLPHHRSKSKGVYWPWIETMSQIKLSSLQTDYLRYFCYRDGSLTNMDGMFLT